MKHLLLWASVMVLLLVVIVSFMTNTKKENLLSCPIGCISITPDPCPDGYKLNKNTNQCAPRSSVIL